MDLELELNLTGASDITRPDTHTEQKHTLAVSTLRTAQCLFLISAGWSAVHTMPLIPAPVHLSCRCFLSVWAKTFYLNLLRVPLKGLCYCSEPSCVCVTWESSAAWPSPNTLVHMRARTHTHTHTCTHAHTHTHTCTHSRFCLVVMEELG